MSIFETYVARTPESRRIGARAEAVMPGGDTRAAGFHLPYPLTLANGTGARVRDVDGHEYWDVIGNYTSLVHGHAYPPIVAAADRAIAGGTAWPARNEGQIALAEAICARVDSVELVRFCNSGSEANMVALGVARVATGRTKVLIARSGYHGSHEAFATPAPGAPGWDHTVHADFGDLDSFLAAIDHHGPDLAAVFLEPVMGSAGLVQAPAGFHAAVAEATRAAGAVFVLDEVITLRLGPGGHQGALGVRPDLTTMGKIIGGGFPVGAIGGRADLMGLLDPRAGRMFHSGTFNGNPVTTAAGLVSFGDLTPAAIDRLDGLGARLESRLCAAGARHGLPLSVRRVGSLLHVFLATEPPTVAAGRPDAQAAARFHLAGMNHGCYFAARGMLAMSTVMDEAAVDDIGDRLDAAIADVAAESS